MHDDNGIGFGGFHELVVHLIWGQCHSGLFNSCPMLIQTSV